MIRILLVDDQLLMRMGFRMILESQEGIEVVGEAGTGDEAVRLAALLQPDVVLMDVRMPGDDGVSATRRIVDSGSASRILILTTFDLDEYAFAGLRAGASGFMLKDVPPAELLAAIQAVASGDAVVSPRITRKLLDAYAGELPTAMTEGVGPGGGHSRLDRLTAREFEVLTEVATGLSNAEIAAKLVVSEATVKTHVTRMLTKLELRDRVQAVVFAYQNKVVAP
jgi:DNA-binding NarL/FixJ family response regulator